MVNKLFVETNYDFYLHTYNMLFRRHSNMHVIQFNGICLKIIPKLSFKSLAAKQTEYLIILTKFSIEASVAAAADSHRMKLLL